MEVPIEIPKVEGMRGEAATIVRWLKKTGDLVSKDEPLVLVEFPKVEVEIQSPVTGRLGKILHGEGRMRRVNDVIGYVTTS